MPSALAPRQHIHIAKSLAIQFHVVTAETIKTLPHPPLTHPPQLDLATLVKREFADPWDWIERLDERSQPQVLGYWELAKRKGVDVGPVAATTLSQLLGVVAKRKDLLQRLGFASRNAFEEETGSIPDTRNKVMHPVRPLVLNQEEVRKVRDAVLCVSSLTEQLLIPT
jgi:hypothetical protein